MKRKATMTERKFQRYYARILLTEARRRKGQTFAATLLQWAKKGPQSQQRSGPPRHLRGCNEPYREAMHCQSTGGCAHLMRRHH